MLADHPVGIPLLRTFLAAAPVPAYMLDARGTVLGANRAFCALVGAAPDGVEGARREDVTALLEPLVEDVGQLRATANRLRCVPGGAFEDVLRLRDGRVLQRMVRPLALADDARGWAVAFHDVTALSRAADAAEDHTARLRAAEQLAGLGSWEWEPDTDVAWWSDELHRIAGVDPGTFVPCRGSAVEALHPEDRPIFEAALERSTATGAPVDCEVRVPREDGERIVHIRAVTDTTPDGRVARLRGTVHDRTEERRKDTVLRHTRQRLEAAFDGSPIGAALLDMAGRVTRANAAFAALAGEPQDALTGKDVGRLVHPDDLRRAQANLERLVAGELDHLRDELRLRAPDAQGGERWVAIASSILRDACGAPREILLHTNDATERRRSLASLEHRVSTDALTGLRTAGAFAGDVAAALQDGATGAVLVLDLDRFKAVNDAFGTAAADDLLTGAAARLCRAAHEIAPDGPVVVARSGGDDFAVFLPGVATPVAAHDAGEALRRAVAEPVDLGGTEVTLGATAGAVLALEADATVEDLLREARAALTSAKDAGRGVTVVFDDAARAALADDAALERDLRRAIAGGGLSLAFQPVVQTDDGSVAGLEALARWHHPQRGDVSPGRFIPLAERSALIVPLGWWVLERVVERVAAWRAEHGAIPVVGVNVAPQQLAQRDFCSRLRALLDHHGVPPTSILLEITEREAFDHAGGMLREIEDAGIPLTIDDFGTGFSSFGSLHALPVSCLKLDRSFVRGLPEDPQAVAIVDAMVRMSRALGVVLVVEGVETTSQLEVVRALGASLVQGFLFARPLPEAQVDDVLAHGLPEARERAVPVRGATITLGEAAVRLGVSDNTARRWADQGRLPAVRTAGGHRRFRASDVAQLADGGAPGAQLRAPRPPESALPALAAALVERRDRLVELAVRSAFEHGQGAGWYVTDAGSRALQTWVEQVAVAAGAGDFALVREATRQHRRIARFAGTRLVETATVLEALCQVMRPVLLDVAGGEAEAAGLARLAALVRRGVLEDDER
ncbi:EAL domain-containing protein [Conexibacter sp. SYSU D00693]|uniref:EAL domain-containing protein n=1 Tax=Conexibacter sp. SYSU D00693 TaxID=2812560 RepID=UPI00196ABD95|nr:EAL domain-containing protein [Conexibacter sp. SYSU D00693]